MIVLCQTHHCNTTFATPFGRIRSTTILVEAAGEFIRIDEERVEFLREFFVKWHRCLLSAWFAVISPFVEDTVLFTERRRIAIDEDGIKGRRKRKEVKEEERRRRNSLSE